MELKEKINLTQMKEAKLSQMAFSDRRIAERKYKIKKFVSIKICKTKI